MRAEPSRVEPHSSADTDLDSWLAQRGLLNHDILCNQLLVELAAAKKDPQDHPLMRLTLWVRREAEYRTWLSSTVEVLSLAHVLDSPLFETWNQHTKTVFRPIFHGMFLAVSGIHKRVDELNRLLTEALSQGNCLLQIPQEMRTEQDFVRVHERLEQFSSAISSLPKEIGDF